MFKKGILNVIRFSLLYVVMAVVQIFRNVFATHLALVICCFRIVYHRADFCNLSISSKPHQHQFIICICFLSEFQVINLQTPAVAVETGKQSSI